MQLSDVLIDYRLGITESRMIADESDEDAIKALIFRNKAVHTEQLYIEPQDGEGIAIRRDSLAMRHSLRPGYILATARFSRFSAAIVPSIAADMYAHKNLLVLRPDEFKVSPEYLTLLLRSDPVVAEIQQRAKTTKRDGEPLGKDGIDYYAIGVNELISMPISIPDKSQQTVACKQYKSFLYHQSRLRQEIEEVRDEFWREFWAGNQLINGAS